MLLGNLISYLGLCLQRNGLLNKEKQTIDNVSFQFVARNLWILYLKRKFSFTVKNKNYSMTLEENVIIK